MVIGGVDSGKTTFCKFLVAQACNAGIVTALVDADVGQSTLGPPTTIGAKIFQRPEDAWRDDVHPPFLHFVGGTSPVGRVFTCVTGAHRALDWARQNGATLIVVDTTGLVDGELGKELKTRKVELLSPDLVVGIVRGDELEHILQPLEKLGIPVVRLMRCEAVLVRSPAVRQQSRLQKFQEYFRHSQLQEFALDEIAVADCPANLVPHFHPNQILSTLPSLVRPRLTGLLVGLEAPYGCCLEVGLIEDYDLAARRMNVRIPFVLTKKITCIRFGRAGIE